jgi:hypothetical protein
MGAKILFKGLLREKEGKEENNLMLFMIEFPDAC